jgi:nucleolar pre-ribosomal-associated protein 2
MVSQFGIESILAALTTLASPKSPGLPQAHGPSIYASLCQTTNILLSLHRKHIGERFHLLIPLLQNLLSSLFILHSYTNPLPSQSPPPWLGTHSHPLSGWHAIAYTRILLTLTQPTVSSATTQHSRKANNFLVDETRKARQYAGKYVPYVLMHYCNLLLVGRLTTDVRKSLLTGIWACIDIVPKEGLRAMNAGMGRDERSIWATVWSDWNQIHERGKG